MEEYLYTKGLWSKWIYTDASPSIHVVSLPIPASLTTSMHICALDYHYNVFVTLETLILVKSVENTAPAMLLEVSTGGGGGCSVPPHPCISPYIYAYMCSVDI